MADTRSCTATNVHSATSESLIVFIQEGPAVCTKGADGNIQTEETALLNHCAQQPPEPTAGSSTPARTWRQIFTCPPEGLLAQTVTNGM